MLSIDKYTQNEMWDEISYPFPNSKCETVEVWEWISNVKTQFEWMQLLIHAGIEVKLC